MRQSTRLTGERGVVHEARRRACLALQSDQVELVASSSVANSTGGQICAGHTIWHSAGVTETVSAVQKEGGRVIASQAGS